MPCMYACMCVCIFMYVCTMCICTMYVCVYVCVFMYVLIHMDPAAPTRYTDYERHNLKVHLQAQ